MNIPQIVDAVCKDLALVAMHDPNERLPKEHQIRCCLYATIRPQFDVVCAERGYASIDDGSRIQCDLWAKSSDKDIWLEIKRCQSISRWQNKPPEQLVRWEADVAKLRKLPDSSDRYFLLVGFFDFDPLNETESSHSEVVQNIGRFYPRQLVHRTTREFGWRANNNISRIGAWVWHWPVVEQDK